MRKRHNVTRSKRHTYGQRTEHGAEFDFKIVLWKAEGLRFGRKNEREEPGNTMLRVSQSAEEREMGESSSAVRSNGTRLAHVLSQMHETGVRLGPQKMRSLTRKIRPLRACALDSELSQLFANPVPDLPQLVWLPFPIVDHDGERQPLPCPVRITREGKHSFQRACFAANCFRRYGL